jgi:hypothetical protein
VPIFGLNCTLIEILSCSVKTLLQKYKRAIKGINDTRVPFEELTCSLDASKVSSWEKDEKKAMDQHGEHLDIYQIKVSNQKFFKLLLLMT